jgi:hypothetical protein
LKVFGDHRRRARMERGRDRGSGRCRLSSRCRQAHRRAKDHQRTVSHQRERVGRVEQASRRRIRNTFADPSSVCRRPARGEISSRASRRRGYPMACTTATFHTSQGRESRRLVRRDDDRSSLQTTTPGERSVR